jgi:hypothetical protein
MSLPVKDQGEAFFAKFVIAGQGEESGDWLRRGLGSLEIREWALGREEWGGAVEMWFFRDKLDALECRVDVFHALFWKVAYCS